SGSLKLALWGSGDIATIRFTQIKGPYVYGPNVVTARHGGVIAAHAAPCLVIRGARLESGRAARKCAWWRQPSEVETRERPAEARRELTVPWDTVITELRGSDIVICAGATLEEARSGLAPSIEAIAAEAQAYAARCDALPDAEPLLRSMVTQGLHVA